MKPNKASKKAQKPKLKKATPKKGPKPTKKEKKAAMTKVLRQTVQAYETEQGE